LSTTKFEEEEFNQRVQDIIDHIDQHVDELWERGYPSFDDTHPLKNVLKAALILEVNNKLKDTLLESVIRGD